jgi:hypothetical protein
MSPTASVKPTRGIEQLQPRDQATLQKARAAFFDRLTCSFFDVKPAPGEVISEKNETLTNGEAGLVQPGLVRGAADQGTR